jgi:hypothetical protein
MIRHASAAAVRMATATLGTPAQPGLLTFQAAGDVPG